MHIAQTLVEGFSLSKKFLMGKVFPKYPEIFDDISEQSRMRYNRTIKDEILRHKNLHIEMVNKRASYNNINIQYKENQSKHEEDNSTVEMLRPLKNNDFGLSRIH